jgi:hypothetical protein
MMNPHQHTPIPAKLSTKDDNTANKKGAKHPGFGSKKLATQRIYAYRQPANYEEQEIAHTIFVAKRRAQS